MSRKGRLLLAASLATLSILALTLLAWPRGRQEIGMRLNLAKPKLLGGVDLKVVARGFRRITDIQFVPGRSDEAVVLVQEGTARVVKLGGAAVAHADKSPVLLEVEVRSQSEQGLLGLAFHPRFVENGLFYLNYNPKAGERRTRIAEWHMAPAEVGRARASERRVLLEVAQPYPNHKAGQLAFGPDGFLYVGFGDGGAGGDPHGHGQNLGTLLATMLRIDVNARDPGREYAIPKDNPFVGREGARPEIWAYGLRNPWRYSFDPGGRLVVADVGQNKWEEIDIVSAGDNLGWNPREGRHCYSPPEGCRKEGMVEPIFEYGRELGESVTGGYVYLGKSVPSLHGQYLFADYMSGALWALRLPKPIRYVEARPLGKFPRRISTFGRDASGEVYLGDYTSGEVLRLVATK